MFFCCGKASNVIVPGKPVAQETPLVPETLREPEVLDSQDIVVQLQPVTPLSSVEDLALTMVTTAAIMSVFYIIFSVSQQPQQEPAIYRDL